MLDTDKLWNAVLSLVMAAAGGFAKILHEKDKSPVTLWGALSALFISAFAGALTFLFATGTGLPAALIGGACGVAGWFGAKAIDAVAKQSPIKMTEEKRDDES